MAFSILPVFNLKKITLIFLFSTLQFFSAYAYANSSSENKTAENKMEEGSLNPLVVKASSEPLFNKLNIFYYTQFMGESFSFPGNGRAYNVYTDSLAPKNLYQSLVVKYSLLPAVTIGASGALYKNLTSNVPTPWGGVFKSDWSLYQPRLFVETKSNFQFFHTTHQLFIELPTHENSRKNKHWTALQLTESFRLNNLPQGFSAGINASWTWHYYSLPDGWITQYFTTGHVLNYKFSPHWEIGSYSFFDLAYIHPYSWMEQKNFFEPFTQTATAKEHLRILANYRPWSDGLLRLAPFIQTNVFYPSLENSVLGFELEWTFDGSTTKRF